MPDFDQIWPSYYSLLSHRLSNQDHLKLYWIGACLFIKKRKAAGYQVRRTENWQNMGDSHYIPSLWFGDFMWLIVSSSLNTSYSHTQHIQHLTGRISLLSSELGGVKWVCARERHLLRVRLAFHFPSCLSLGPERLLSMHHSEEERDVGPGSLHSARREVRQGH